MDESKKEEDEDSKQLALLPSIEHNEGRFPCALFGYQHAAELSMNDGFEDIIARLCNLERYCDAPCEKLSRWSNNVDVSLEEAFHYPSRVSDRIPLDLPPQNQFSDKTLRTTWCRLVSHCFEWIAGIPEMRLLSDPDKLTLVTGHLYRLISLNVCYSTYRAGWTEGLNFGYGMYYKPSEECQLSAPDSHVLRARLMHDGIVSVFRKIKLRPEEFVLVKIIVLMANADALSLSDNGLSVISNSLRKYMSHLCDFWSKWDYSKKETMERIVDIMSVIPYLEIVRKGDERCLIEWTKGNEGEFHGQLTSQLHFHITRG